jgi:hypothetical protein
MCYLGKGVCCDGLGKGVCCDGLDEDGIRKNMAVQLMGTFKRSF